VQDQDLLVAFTALTQVVFVEVDDMAALSLGFDGLILDPGHPRGLSTS
jgi:hypothetical protein